MQYRKHVMHSVALISLSYHSREWVLKNAMNIEPSCSHEDYNRDFSSHIQQIKK